jgi:hypothetical protein
MAMVQLPIPTGSYQSPDLRASCRRLVNAFSEQAPQDTYGGSVTGDSKQKAPPVVLRRAAGITSFATDGSGNPVRGAWAMGGIEYVVIGSNLYTVTAEGVLNLIGGGIAGNSFVRMTDNTECLVILLPGTTTAYTYTVANGLQPLTAAGFVEYGAIDCWFLDSYIFFLANNGRSIFNDDGQAVSGTGQITFNLGNVFPREFGTDPFVGMAISNRNIYAFGQRTSEVYVDTGTSSSVGSPLADAPNGFLQIGMLPGAAYTAVLQNNTVFWLANDRTIRNLNGISPVRVSNHGIEAILAGIDVTGSYGFAYSLSGHLFAAWTFPAADAGRTIVYDCTTGEWHEMNSFGLGYWRPLCCHNAFGKYLVGDSQGSGLGTLDVGSRTEWGTVRTSTWIHQPVYQNNNRVSFRRVELVLGGGFAPLTGNSQDVDPLITMMVSDDGGMTFRSFPDRSLGTTGQYQNRIVWFNAGMSRQRVFGFELSANAESWVTDLTADVEVARW